jgi:hypothetical protein
MAMLSGTTVSYGVTSAGGMREDLSDVIFDLFPEDTWALSHFDREEANSTYTEWLAQELAAPAANAQEEGNDASYASLTAPTRYGSYLQISSKTFLVSDSLEAATKAGRKSELARGAIVKMRELKRDMEYTIMGRQISTEGGAGTARTTAGIEAWIGDATASAAGPSHVVLATTSATYSTPPVTSGKPSTATTYSATPTTGAFTSASLNYALQHAWEQGGDPRVILAMAGQKRAIDAFTSVATRFVDVGKSAQATITGAANLYVSDFGTHQVILNRYGQTGIVLCIDPSYWAVRYLRKPLKRELARTGDATKYQIITEWALVARNWKANAKVVGCADA